MCARTTAPAPSPIRVVQGARLHPRLVAAAASSGVAAEQYRVEWIRITTPDDVSVIDPTPSPAVTLVGCYPFYHVGSAPKRFIVRAVPVAGSAPGN